MVVLGFWLLSKNGIFFSFMCNYYREREKEKRGSRRSKISAWNWTLGWLKKKIVKDRVTSWDFWSINANISIQINNK